MASYKNIEFDEKMVKFVRHMNAVEEYRETLQGLQMVWDNLTLLGQMSGAGTDMSETRRGFSELTSNLLNELGKKTLQKCVVEMGAKAQVAIDILVRNLFERTADIGFLATDDDVREFIRDHSDDPGTPAHQDATARLRTRFAEYVAKYSVYSDIILLNTAGAVLARLDDTVAVSRTLHPLVQESLTTAGAYVENYGAIDLLPQHASALVYSYRVTDATGNAIGVLCLCFKLEDEVGQIFANLSGPDDWAVLMLLDAAGQVIASSDAFHVPLRTRFEKVLDHDWRVIRFAGREYLATTRATQGYQGYLGPGWFGHVMLPIQHAFNKEAADELHGVDASVLHAVMGNASLFGAELRSIPAKANSIQRDLNRTVWNGNVHRRSQQQGTNQSFSRILLWEISNTGNRTKDVFSRSIADLHETAISSILQDCRFFAGLAVDIMDRNLYERANDCRWWALTSAFRERLANGPVSGDAAEQIAAILRTINGLYTVYSNLIVFDRHGRVIVTSHPELADFSGSVLDEEWAQRVLRLEDSQGYVVSAFAATPTYSGRHTYVYGAAIRAMDGAAVVGGVGIVFDSEPQFRAMLQDALPRNDSGDVMDGTFGVFAERSGRIIASTHPDHQPGDVLGMQTELLSLAPGENQAGIVLIDGVYYAAGAHASAGYREYKGENDPYRNEVIALILAPLCEASASRTRIAHYQRPVVRSNSPGGEATVEIATLRVGDRWFGIRSQHITEAVEHIDTIGIPGAGSDLAGYLMYKERPIPIFDISRIVNDGHASDYPAPQVIILQQDDGTHFGILADDLGEIPEVFKSRLQILPPYIAGGNVLAESIVMTDKPESETLLIVLSIERIASRLAASADAAPSMLLPAPLEELAKI